MDISELQRPWQSINTSRHSNRFTWICAEWSPLTAHCAVPTHGSTEFYTEFSGKAGLVYFIIPLHSYTLLQDHQASLQNHSSILTRPINVNGETVHKQTEMDARENDAATVILTSTELKPPHNGLVSRRCA